MTIHPTAVYLIKNTWSEANFKIGITANIPRRIAEIEDQYGVDARLIYACWFPDKVPAGKAEWIWHKRYSHLLTDDHGGKEWFSLGKEQVSEFFEWSKLSLPELDLKKKIFMVGSSKSEIRSLTDQLFQGIPKRQNPNSIDLWRHQSYLMTNFTTTTNESPTCNRNRKAVC
jgi:predicted GIY-YIG superfamily endonuclease